MHGKRPRFARYAALAVTMAAVMWGLWFIDFHISRAGTSRSSPADSVDCKLVRIAVQAAYPDFLGTNEPVTTFRGPMQGCTRAVTGVDVRRETMRRRAYMPFRVSASGPWYSVLHTSALVLLTAGDSVEGSRAVCRVQRWPWGWRVLTCRKGGYLV